MMRIRIKHVRVLSRTKCANKFAPTGGMKLYGKGKCAKQIFILLWVRIYSHISHLGRAKPNLQILFADDSTVHPVMKTN